MVGPRYHPSLMHLSQVRGLISPHFLRLGLLCVCVRERERERFLACPVRIHSPP
jgi:hypothetical protein